MDLMRQHAPPASCRKTDQKHLADTVLEQRNKIGDAGPLCQGSQHDPLEKETLDSWYKMLPNTHGILDPQTNKVKAFNNDQSAFVKNVLTSFVRYNVPRLDQVLALYGLDMNVTFVREDDAPWFSSI